MKITHIVFTFMIISQSLLAQAFVITGKIIDAKSGESLPFSNVRVINTTLGTATNSKGFYELKLSAGKYSLVASYIGYYSDTINVELESDLKKINFTLRKTEIILPEVVILPGENPALEIIRKAIKKKNERNELLNGYEYEAYTKGLVRTRSEEHTSELQSR